MTKAKTRGLGVSCPYCHADDGALLLNLNDLEELRCPECDEAFSAEAARDIALAEAARWESVLRLIELGRKLAAGELSA